MENYPFLTIFCQFLEKPSMFKENLPKKGPLFREFWTQKPTHMGGTYPYPQHVMLPPPPREPHWKTHVTSSIFCGKQRQQEWKNERIMGPLSLDNWHGINLWYNENKLFPHWMIQGPVSRVHSMQKPCRRYAKP